MKVIISQRLGVIDAGGPGSGNRGHKGRKGLRDGKDEKPVNVHRASEDFLTLERYDAETGKWVDNPGLIAVTGMGGDNSYVETTESEAQSFIDANAISKIVVKRSSRLGL